MAKVSDIFTNQPHITIQGKNRVHVMPVSLIEDVIDGKMDITQIEDWQDFLPTILDDWLQSI